MAGKAGHRGFGSIRQRSNGRFQVRYTGPDLGTHTAPHTFDLKADAEQWLATTRAAIIAGTWTPRPAPAAPAPDTLAAYSAAWLATRPLKPRTRQEYRRLLDSTLLPTLGALPLPDITSAHVRGWYAQLNPAHPTKNAHAYALLKAICSTAAEDEVIGSNPCRIRGAGATRRARTLQPATLRQLATIVEHTPPRYRALVLTAAWCACRFGELAELRRTDVDVAAGVLHIRRAVTRVAGADHVDSPKSEAGVRDVAVPPHLRPVLAAHLLEHSAPGPQGLVFPAPAGGRLIGGNQVQKWFGPARAAAGRPDLRLHDLRHTGAVLAAQSGATLAELMARLGHSTVGAALRYQHAAEGRDQLLAQRLSQLAETADS